MLLTVKNKGITISDEALLPIALVCRKIIKNSSIGNDSVVVVGQLMPERVIAVKGSQIGVGTRFFEKTYFRKAVGQLGKSW